MSMASTISRKELQVIVKDFKQDIKYMLEASTIRTIGSFKRVHKRLDEAKADLEKHVKLDTEIQEKLNKKIERIQWWLIGVLGALALSLLGILLKH